MTSLASGPRAIRAAVGISIAILVAAVWAVRSTGLRATYFLDPDWQTPAYTIIDRRITLDTLTGSAPVSPDQPFSARWFGYLNVRRSGTYRFFLEAAGDATLAIEGAPSRLAGVSAVGHPLDLNAGPHAISISYTHQRGRYGLELRVSADDSAPQPVSSVDLSPSRRGRVMSRVVALLQPLSIVVLTAWAVVGCAWLLREVSSSVSLVLTGATVVFVSAVIFDAPPWLRGPAPYPISWQWPYHDPGAVWRIGPAGLGAVGVIAAIAYLSPRDIASASRRRARAGLAAALVAGSVYQIGMLHLGQGGAVATVGERTRNDIYTSYFGVAVGEIDTKSLLANYSAMVRFFPVHARTHPPGPILYYRVLARSVRAASATASAILRSLASLNVPVRRFADETSADAWLAIAALVSGFGTVVLGLLTGWLIALIVEASGVDAFTAARAGALWALCPAAAYFLPTFEAVNTFLVAAVCALGAFALVARTTAGAAAAAAGAGIAGGLALFCSFGTAPMLLAAAAVALAATLPTTWPRVALTAALAGLGVAVVWIVPIAAGLNLLDTFRVAMELHRDHYMPAGRWLWLRFNLLDFANFIGWAVVLWTAILAADAHDWRRARLAVVITGALVIIDLADLTRSEVSRLWMPLMPLVLTAAGTAASSRVRRFDFAWVAVLIAASSIVIGLYWS